MQLVEDDRPSVGNALFGEQWHSDDERHVDCADVDTLGAAFGSMDVVQTVGADV